MSSPTFYELQAKAKAGRCFIVAKSTEYLLYRQMPEGTPNQMIGKRKAFEDMDEAREYVNANPPCNGIN